MSSTESTSTPTSVAVETANMLGLPLPSPRLLGRVLGNLNDERIALVGGGGGIGVLIQHLLGNADIDYRVHDLDDGFDITEPESIDLLASNDSTIIINLAAQKHAPLGETDIERTAMVNYNGTLNCALGAAQGDKRLVTVSTCKAIEPQTVYGASKLLAERATLKWGGRVARLHNVLPATGNVLEVWQQAVERGEQPIVHDATHRYYISSLQAALLILLAATDALPEATTMITSNESMTRRMSAMELYHRASTNKLIESDEYHHEWRRYGDRTSEPFIASNEREQILDGVEGAVIGVRTEW